MVTKTCFFFLITILVSTASVAENTKIQMYEGKPVAFLEIKTKQTVGETEFIEDDGLEEGDGGLLGELDEDSAPILEDDTATIGGPLVYIPPEEVIEQSEEEVVYLDDVLEGDGLDAIPEDELNTPIDDPLQEEECDCIDGANCLQEVEVEIQCIDGECSVKLLTDTDIDFKADLALKAYPVEDNGHCCE